MARIEPLSRTLARFAISLGALALASLPVGCTSETSPSGAAPGGSGRATPAPAAISGDEGTIVPASLPPEIREEIAAAKATLEAAKAEVAAVVGGAAQHDPAKVKELEERLARAEAHLTEILERAEKAAGAGGE